MKGQSAAGGPSAIVHVMQTSALTTLAAGFALGASFIVAIGAQNAFVLKQGLQRSHVLAVVTVCTGVDWTLITLGALGVGTFIARYPVITLVTSIGGAIFLFVYGVLSFRAALHPAVLRAEPGDASVTSATLAAAVATTLAVSLLNPHVYLDTLVLLGSIAARYPAEMRLWFALGAGLASFVWFFGLGFGARLLAPVFARPAAWRVLDVGIGLIMWSIAVGLLVGLLR
jgi:L-lysine exporter family protein LysE/ArgO